MKQIKKQFGGIHALRGVDLEVFPGEVLALIGENGAGKSTLMKILSGALAATEGEVFIAGKQVALRNPQQAISEGISTIYQELNNFDTLNVAENIFANRLPRNRLRLVDRERLFRACEDILRTLDFPIDPNTPESQLTIAQKQIVEIAKAVSAHARILIMDEPTAALNNKEVEMLYKVIRTLKNAGTGIIYISHRLDEVFDISDRVVVMRDGQNVMTRATERLSRKEIITAMVGKEVADPVRRERKTGGEVMLRVNGISGDHFRDVSLCARKGEIVGLYGLMGSGKDEIIKALFGLVKIQKGTIELGGKEVRIRKPKEAIGNHIAYIPDDRKREGLMLDLPIFANITVTVLKELYGTFGLSGKKERDFSERWIRRLRIKAPDIKNRVRSLSGGNQQKVVMAKWLGKACKVLILNEPTRGVDVSARAEIYALIEQMCSEGLAVLMTSSDLDEIMTVPHRVLVVRDGEIVAELGPDALTQARLMEHAIGG